MHLSKYDELYVISDIHMGGSKTLDQDFQVFNHGTRLAKFILYLAESRPKDDVCLILNGDIILIFDECTSGFRETYGGLHKKYNVNPDIAVFGKAIGNGYAITGILGKKEIMKYWLKNWAMKKCQQRN